MLKKLRLVAVLLLIHSMTAIPAQEMLTLEEAVTSGYGSLVTANMSDLTWLPNSGFFSYRKMVDDEEQVWLGHADGRTPVMMMSPEGVKDAFIKGGFVGPETIPPFDWLDKDHVIFKFKGQYWQYLIGSKAVGKRVSCVVRGQDRNPAPDYTKIAFTIDNDLFYSTLAEDSVRLTSNPEGVSSGAVVSRYEFGIHQGSFWSNNSKMLAYYENDHSAVEDYPLIQYAGIPAVEEATPYPMAGHSSEKLSLKTVDVSMKTTQVIQTGQAEDAYITTVGWPLDDKEIYVGTLSRNQNDFELAAFDPKSGKKLRTLFTESNDKYFEPEKDIYFIPGSKKGEFIWFSERDGYMHAYLYDKKGKLLRQLTSGEHVMHKILHCDTQERMVYIEGTGSPIETVVWKVSLDGKMMKRITTEKGSHRVQFSTNGKYMLDAHRSLDVPRDIKLKNNDGKLIREIFSAPSALADKRIGTTEIYTIPAADGTELYCRMIKPSDFDPAKQYPVLVYVYNGPNVQLIQDTWLGGASLWMHHLAERGYLVFTLDGRGSGNRGLAFEQSTHRQLGIKETDDQMTGVAHLKSLPYVDAERLAVHGWSYGGFMTLNLMLRHPEVFKAGVAGGAVTDWRFYEVMYTERYMDEPADNPEGYEATRMTALASQLNGDLLMIHGSSDDIVVPQHFMVMLNAFINADKQVDTFIYPGHGHNVRGPDRIHLIRQLVEYLEEHL